MFLFIVFGLFFDILKALKLLREELDVEVHVLVDQLLLFGEEFDFTLLPWTIFDFLCRFLGGKDGNGLDIGFL